MSATVTDQVWSTGTVPRSGVLNLATGLAHIASPGIEEKAVVGASGPVPGAQVVGGQSPATAVTTGELSGVCPAEP